MRYSDAVKVVAEEMDLPLEVVKLAYRSYWKFIKSTIKSLPLKEDLNREEFDKLRTNFNIPSIGKLNCTFDRMVGVKKRYEYIKKLRNDKSKEG